jgi:glutaredoxin
MPVRLRRMFARYIPCRASRRFVDLPFVRSRLRHMRRRCLLLLALSVLLFPAADSTFAQGDDTAGPITIHLFWSEGCPHCAKARRFLEEATQRDPAARLREYEISVVSGNEALFEKVSAAFEIDVLAVPLIVVGDQAFVGYLDDQSTGQAILQTARTCQRNACPDIVGFLERQRRSESVPPGGDGTDTTAAPAPWPEVVRLPLIGDVATGALSLPALTVILAAVDGFNPCAMWVLVFLIGLLLGMTDHLRMWVLGGAFLLASAAVYFALMAAWLNLLLLLGALVWIRIAVGIVALAGGACYIRDFIRNPAGLCPVARPEQRQRILDRLRQTVRESSFLLALGGIVAVAIAVNLVDLLCSAGIPAVYTQVLALSALPVWQHYLYLLLYILIFLLDDLVVFVTAMATLQASGLTAQYARYSHLIGGGVLVGLGMLLLFRPEWLAFGA